MKIVGVSDHTAAYYDPKGLPLPEINQFVEEHGVLNQQLRKDFERWHPQLRTAADPVCQAA